MTETLGLNDAAALFIRQYDWSWWCHLTFTQPPTWVNADKIFRRWMNKLNRRTFGRNYYRRPNQGLRWLRGVELQQRDAIHFHVLVAGDPKMHHEEAVRDWVKKAGDAQISVYDPTLGAANYIVKEYAACGNLDMGGVWTRVPSNLSGLIKSPAQGTQGKP